MKTNSKSTTILGVLLTAAVLLCTAADSSAQERKYPNNRVPTKKIGDIDSNEVFMGNPNKRPAPPAAPRAPLSNANAAFSNALKDVFKK